MRQGPIHYGSCVTLLNIIFQKCFNGVLKHARKCNMDSSGTINFRAIFTRLYKLKGILFHFQKCFNGVLKHARKRNMESNGTINFRTIFTRLYDLKGILLFIFSRDIFNL
jgi:hypothetical protein